MIEIRNLHKKLEGRTVLESVDLDIYDGETLTVVGKSGCGKTTLVKLLIGLITADEGSIRLDGEEISGYNEDEFNRLVRNRMTMVFQHGALWDSKTIEENIDLALNLRKGLSVDERKRLVQESLERVGLDGTEKLYPQELSGGMMKRAAIARAVAAQPDYLLYDEPTTGLDPVLSRMVSELIVKLDQELGTTSLVISHDVHTIPEFSDRVAMLQGGNIILTCEADDMWNQNNTIFNNFLHGRMDE